MRSLDPQYRNFFKTWSAEMAYVLGYFAADGSMIKNQRGSSYIEITSTDRVLLESVKKLTNAPQTIAERRTEGNEKRQYRLQMGCSIWFEDLMQLGFTPRKSLSMRFPKVPDTYHPDFIRGYFDGDGCIYVNRIKFADRRKKRLIVMSLFTSGSREFLLDLHRILKVHGVCGGSLVSKQRGYELKFSHRDSVALYRFLYHTNPVPVSLPRKRVKFERAMRLLKVHVRS
jgi:intein-encoded DNA endonuclease-like protein